MQENLNKVLLNIPYHQQYNRVLIIQSKIYKATRHYNLNSLYKLQNFLLTSEEAKKNSLKYVLNEIYLYNYFNKTQYYLDKYNENIIFYLLNNFDINKYYDKYIYLIINQIKQRLIYLCIEPEWKAKFGTINHIKTNELCYHYDNNRNKDKLVCELRRKIKYIYQNLSFQLTLKTDYYINLFNYHQFNEDKNYSYYEIYSFFMKIIMLKSSWHLFFNKISNKNLTLYYYINKSNIWNYIYKYIKSTIWKKDSYNNFKLNTFLSKNYILNNMANNLTLFYSNLFSILRSHNIRSIYVVLNTLLHLIYKKRKYYIFFLNFHAIKYNYRANILFYNCKIKFNYLNLV